MLAAAEPPAQAVNQAVERLIEEVNAAWQSVLAGLSIEDLLGEVGPSQRASQGESWE
jgi:hypothetical protein